MMTKMIGLFFILGLVSSAYAADGSSGCGLGWQVMKKNSLVSSALRASTNATFLNTVAMTSGTSGCAQHSIVKNDKADIHYAEANYEQLVSEMAQGKGETLSAFAEVLGCGTHTSQFGQYVQAQYQSLSEKSSPSELVQSIKADQAFTQACALI
jgi:hypothetical protein